MIQISAVLLIPKVVTKHPNNPGDWTKNFSQVYILFYLFVKNALHLKSQIHFTFLFINELEISVCPVPHFHLTQVKVHYKYFVVNQTETHGLQILSHN